VIKLAENQQTFTFRVPLEFDLETRELIAEDVIDLILRRTSRGLDKNNRPFKSYSKSYTESLDFKNAGKSKSRVDLELSGDMLTGLEIVNIQTAGFIVIGFEEGSEENDRAAWNRNNLRPSHPKRDFLGITDKDLNKILSRYRQMSREEARLEKERQNRVTEEAKRLLSRFTFGR
jgi:hypothetical protein